MLELLKIDNIAVIEKTEIEFGRGLNILTGETGAGKSIVIDALEAALGWRTSRDIVRTGAAAASVTAVFSNSGAEKWCEDNGIDIEDELVLFRKISADGKNSCRVNGVPVSASQLKELGLCLIDIHGQGEGQRLMDEKYHRAYLDNFGGLLEDVNSYKEAYDEYKAISLEIEKLGMDESEKARRLDMLNYQIQEIERAELNVGEFDEKNRQRDFLRSAGKLTGAVNGAFSALYGGEMSDGALPLIEVAADSVAKAMKYFDEMSGIYEKLEGLKYAAMDAVEDLRALREKLDFSPEDLDALEERLDAVKRVLRKYGGTEEAAIDYLESCRAEKENIEFSEENIKKLEVKLKEGLKKAEKLAEDLTKKRAAAAKELSSKIESELHELSMGGAKFEVAVEPLRELSPYGADSVRFLISANAGEVPGRLSKIASGGEVSRVMLAMKSVLADGDEVSAMIFDEIDTGVSGIAAQKMARKLSRIAVDKQVICITHLPQIAAMADTHFLIEKRTENGRTFTDVSVLSDEGRGREIARLTGGEDITETALKAAQEQLLAAREYKASL